jgi:tripartite-type tricarboxylate transporter receptor subunit TctC
MSNEQRSNRRRFLRTAAAGAAGVFVLGRAVHSADLDYPVRPVRIIYPSAAGTSGDARTRLIADRLSTRLKQRFIVEDKPGAVTTIGTAQVARSVADGYTLLATFTPTFPISHLLNKSAGYDPLRSFTPIALFGRGSPFLVATPAFPARSVKDLVVLAKSKPGTVTAAHAGPGSANHLPAELFRRRAGIEFLYVPYKSEANGITDLIGGQVSVMFAYAPLAVPQIKEGKVLPLAYAGPSRNKAVPDVPTISESGYPEFEFHGGMLLMGPAGMPQGIVEVLNWEVTAIMQEPDVRSAFEATGSDPIAGSPEEVAALLRRETKMNGDIITELGITLE